MNIRLKRYKKDFSHSYAFGVFPTLELIRHCPTNVLGVAAHPNGLKNQGVAKIQTICQDKGIPFEFQEKSFGRIGARQNDYAVGVFQKTEPTLDASQDHVNLVHPAGMGNLGTIIRTMLGFGFQDLAVIGSAADIFHPDVVRASMGAIFQLRFQRFPDFDEYLQTFPRNIYPLMTNGEVPLPEINFQPPYGLVFGPENAGLSTAFHDYGTSVAIPQKEAIDSLNLAISVGITLYHAAVMDRNPSYP